MSNSMMPRSAIRTLTPAVGMAALLVLGGARAARATVDAGDAARLSFLPNVGQLAGDARFVAYTADGAILLAPGGIVLAPRRAGDAAALRISYTASNPDASLGGSEALPGRVSYLLGDDPGRWRRDVPSYGRVSWRELYAGVDLEVEGRGNTLKATYTVAPGSDPGAIRWRYDGAEGVAVAATGELAIRVAGRTLSDAPPVAWQEAGGGRREVAVRYALDADGTASFATGEFDPAFPLVIDPHLVYSTLIGGADIDEGRDIAVDAAGNVYVTGSTRSLNMPGAGPPQASYAGPIAAASFGDAFVAKLDPSGGTLLYLTYLGGSADDVADAITVGGDGSVYVTGMTKSADFPVVNALQGAPGGQACSAPPCSDAFVARLNAAGNGLQCRQKLGGSGNENGGLIDLGARSVALGIGLDGADNVLVTGVTESDDFPTPNGAFTTRSGLADVFVAAVRADGQELLYGTYLGGTGVEHSGDLAAEGSGVAVVAGTTLSSSFPVKAALQPALAGGADAFVARIDTTGSGSDSLVSSTFHGGSDADYALAVAVDSFGHASVAGHTLSLDLPTPGGFQTTNGSAGKPSPRDGFVATLSADGSALLYGTYLGGAETDLAYALKGAGSGRLLVAGRTFSDDLPTRDPWQSVRGGSADVFVAYLDPSSTGAVSLLYSTYLGGAASDFAYGLAAGADDAAYIVGATSGTSGDSFPIYRTLGANSTSTGVLVAKLDPRMQYWIPVASRAAGAKGSQWRTDLGVQNGGDSAAAISLRLVAGGKTYTDATTLAADNVTILTDVVGRLSYTGNGAIEVLSSGPVRVGSRTYNAIADSASCYPGGTFGQGYDVATAESGLRAGESAWLAQLVETSAYRTNLIVTNTGRGNAAVTIALYDGAGVFLKSFQLAVPPGEMRLDSQPFLRRAGKNNLQRAYARVFVDTGFGVVTSASVIDNLTNDPTTIAMLPAGFETASTWVPVASRAAGAKGSVWRSDLGLLNPSTLAASVTLRFLSGGKEYTNTTLVAPGSQAILADVIGAIPASGSGSLAVDASQALVVTSRTYNLIAADAACFPKGTLGQTYASADATPVLDAGATGWLVGLTETAGYRTNISLTNTGATTASANVTLYGGAGQSLGSYSVTLAVGEMKQENRPFFNRGGQSNLAAGYARVRVTAGSGVVALASVIDNLTNDPTTIVPQW